MDVYGNTRTKYDIPLNHLDYEYIGKCTDKSELEKIIKILRSGKEGVYPELEKCAEDKLASLDPENKILRKPEKLKTPQDIDNQEWKDIDDDLKNWVSGIKEAERNVSQNQNGSSEYINAPPVRGTAGSVNKSNLTKSASDTKSTAKPDKRVKPRDYREWDKFDIEAELGKVDNSEDKTAEMLKKLAESKPTVNDNIDSSGLNDEVKQMKAEREKNKGNEAFRSGDYEEALVYYNRSITLWHTVAARNNRAQTYLKLKKWSQALDDCEAVLAAEPSNLKAILRRAVANQGLTRYAQAKQDIEVVLAREPNNKQALEVKKALEKVFEEQKSTGRRMIIEEVDETAASTSNDEAKRNKHNVEKSNSHNEEKAKVEDVKLGETASVSERTGTGNASVSEEKPVVDCPAIETRNVSSNSGSFTQMQPTAVSQPPSTSSTCVREALPPAVQALKDAGNDLFHKGQYGDAADKYSAALQLMTTSGSTMSDAINLSLLYSNRAACLMKLGDCQGCIIDCDSALALCPGTAKPLLRRALAYETLEKYRQAYADYRQVLNIDSNADVAQQGSDRCANMLQRLDGPSWRDKLPSIPSNSNLAALVSNLQMNEAPPPATNEMTFETCKAEGNALFTKGEYARAVELFSKCIELFPDRVVPYTNRALCYLKLNQHEAVLSDCNQALSLEFSNVKALFRRAQAYKMLERYEESMIDLETLLKIDPTNSSAKKELQLVVKCKEQESEKRLEASLRKHHRVKIEEDASSDDEKPVKKSPASGKASESRKKPKSSSSPSVTEKSRPQPASVTVPNMSKVTAFEFMQAWSSLKGTKDIVSYVRILDQIQPSDLRKVISNKLDSELLMTIVRCVGHMITNGDGCRGFDFLSNLSTLLRFDTIVMFMSENDKKDVADVFQQLSSSQQLSVDEQQLSILRSKFIVN